MALSKETQVFLVKTATLSGRSQVSIIDSVLAIVGVPGFAKFYRSKGAGMGLLVQVDEQIKLLNSGASIVFHEQHIGCCRFDRCKVAGPGHRGRRVPLPRGRPRPAPPRCLEGPGAAGLRRARSAAADERLQ